MPFFHWWNFEREAEMAPRWLCLEDRLPPHTADALYVPGLCLTWDKTRLTAMNKACIQKAARLIVAGRAKCIIISGCYGEELSNRELKLRIDILRRMGIDPNVIKQIDGITSTDDEIAKLSTVLGDLGARSLLFVSDTWHMPRAVMFAEQYLPRIQIFHCSVRTPRYEYTCEPNPIKVFRCGFGFGSLWVITNVMSYFVAKCAIRHQV